MNMQPQKAPTVAICVPSGRSWEASAAMAVSAICSHSTRMGVGIALMNQNGSMVSASRNDLVDRALKINPDFIFWFDSDMVAPADTLLRLLSHNLDIVGGTYNRRVPPYETLGHMVGKQPQDGLLGGIHEADYLPGGMLLVRAQVYRILGYPYYYETYQWEISSKVGAFVKMISDWSYTDLPREVEDEIRNSKAFRAWLETNVNSTFKESRTMSEDYNFCRKARKHGFKIFCDLDVTFKTGHIGEQVVTCHPAPVASPQNAAEEFAHGAA